MSKVLIAGGCGFIGSHVVSHFAGMGDEVHVVDKLTYAADLSRIEGHVRRHAFTQLDVCDRGEVDRLLNRVKPDVVLNLAAETHVDNSIADSAPFTRSNFEGACSLMDACRRHNAFYAHFSTDEVYGDASVLSGRDHGFLTTDPLKPRNPYSASKAAADLMILANSNTHKQPYLIFRPSNNFGPNQHAEKFLPKLIDCYLNGKPFPLYGDGQQIREWTFVKDTARVVRDTIVAGVKDQVINVSSGFSDTNLNVTRRVEAALRARRVVPADVVRLSADRPGHDRRYWIESDVAAENFRSFSEGLEATLDHYLGVR